MDNRRANITTCRTSPEMIAPPPVACSQIGITTWLDTIVDSAIDATMTMDVADENPPRNDSIANPSRPCDRGTVNTNRSGFDPAGNNASPVTAIGTTNSDRIIR